MFLISGFLAQTEMETREFKKLFFLEFSKRLKVALVATLGNGGIAGRMLLSPTKVAVLIKSLPFSTRFPLDFSKSYKLKSFDFVQL